MSVVAFWSNGKEESAKTLSMVAISTYMAIKHNYRILTVSTRYNDDTLESCYWKKAQTTENFLSKRNEFGIESGIEGLAKALKSNRATPEIITNYTKVVFKDRLEILLPPKTNSYEEYERFFPIYGDLLQVANRYYDLVFVDLNKGLDKKYIVDILNDVDLILINFTQKIKSINEVMALRENNPLFQKGNTLLLLGRYDKFSKFTSKNIARYMGIRNEICTIPYSTLFFDATNDATVDEFFWRFRNINPTDRNAIFIKEVDNTTESIIAKLQELQMRR